MTNEIPLALAKDQCHKCHPNDITVPETPIFCDDHARTPTLPVESSNSKDPQNNRMIIRFEDGLEEQVDINTILPLMENEWLFHPTSKERICRQHGKEYLCEIPKGYWVNSLQFENPQAEPKLDKMLEKKSCYDKPVGCRVSDLLKHIGYVERKGWNDSGNWYLVRWRDYWFAESEVQTLETT
ncbi:hypothetical protein FQN57_005134 [Myotisia sp. PD_48]|nr:hypothetical protein FQN57_005134 [Myotisia sp. PD_48]